MDWLIDILLGLIQNNLASILAGLGALLGGILLYFKGSSDQKKKARIKLQKETIDAHKNRGTVEDRMRHATDDERDGMREPWFRD